METSELIEQAFCFGMIQVKEEITAFAEFLKPREPWNVLEIGSESGGTFYVWCRLVRGIKISLDLPSGSSGSGKYTDLRLLSERQRKMMGWAPNVRIITGDSHTPEAKSKVAAILGQQKLDLLFIDGDHSYEGVKADFEMYRGFVNPGGLIAFHDINEGEYMDRRGCQVGRLWAELKDSGLKTLEFNQKLHWAGIGVVQV